MAPPPRGAAAVGWGIFLLPWFLVAAAYRANWPDRLKAALPSSLAWLHHAFRALLFVPTFFFHGLFPGELGEELGWRGYLVRRWIHRPLVAMAITVPVWASFHLPIVFGVMRVQDGRLDMEHIDCENGQRWLP